MLITRRSGGGLQTSPVLVGVDGQGKLVIPTREGAYKTRNLRRDPTAVLCVVSDRFFGRWIQIEGNGADRVTARGDGQAGRLLPRIRREHPDWDDYQRAMQQQRRVLVRVSIDTVGPTHAG